MWSNDVSLLVGSESQIRPTKGKRNHRANSKEWARSIRKKQRNSGQPYVTKRGVMKPAKRMNADVQCKCPWKCHEKLTREQRQKNYDSFYTNASWDVQTTFIAKSVKTVPIKRRKCDDPAASKKQHTREYYLLADSFTVRVCKQMFMQTLVIDSARIHRALIKGASGNFTDQRGKHVPSNKIAESDLDVVRQHVNSFPDFTNHYSRLPKSGRVFSNPSLNFSTMYRLYCELMKGRTRDAENNGDALPTIVGVATYKRVLKEQSNIKFNTHAKDSLKMCEKSSEQERKQSILNEGHNSGVKNRQELDWEKVEAIQETPQIKKSKHEINTGEPHERNYDCPSTKRKRNLHANPSEWACVVRKRKRNLGEQYVTKRGDIKPAKSMNSDVFCKCPWKCHEKLTHEQRRRNYDSFYSNASWNIQTTYIAKAVKTVPIKRRTCKDPSSSKKQHTREFYLQADNDTVRVCKQMFMQTLVIDSARIHRALIKGLGGNFADQRGRHIPSNKTADSDLNIIREHIGSFAAIPNFHLQRSNKPLKIIVSSDLNGSAMYKMYKEMMEERVKQAAVNGGVPLKILSTATYRRILQTEFNMKFKLSVNDKTFNNVI